MKAAQHAAILFAYLARLSPTQRAQIDTALKEWDYACLNNGTSAQARAMEAAGHTVESAIATMSDYDRDRIRAVIANNS